MELVSEFSKAMGERDRGGLRALPAKDFWFKGPMMSFGDPDSFADAMVKLPFKATAADSRFIADGHRVAHGDGMHTVIGVKNAKPGRHADGGGLYGPGRRYWRGGFV